MSTLTENVQQCISLLRLVHIGIQICSDLQPPVAANNDNFLLIRWNHCCQKVAKKEAKFWKSPEYLYQSQCPQHNSHQWWTHQELVARANKKSRNIFKLTSDRASVHHDDASECSPRAMALWIMAVSISPTKGNFCQTPTSMPYACSFARYLFCGTGHFH